MGAYDKLSGEFNPTVPTRVIFGQGKTATLGSEVADLGGRRVLVLSGRTVAEQTDAVRRAQEALGDSVVGVYSRADAAGAAGDGGGSGEPGGVAGGRYVGGRGRQHDFGCRPDDCGSDGRGHRQCGGATSEGPPGGRDAAPQLGREGAAVAGVHPYHAVGGGVQHGRRQRAGRRRGAQDTGGPSPAVR